jgi:hypothetical protein
LGVWLWANSSLTYDIWYIPLIYELLKNPYIYHSSWHPKKNSWTSSKVTILTSCTAKQVRCPFVLLVQMRHMILHRYTLFKQTSSLESCLCRLTFFFQTEVIHGFIRFCIRSNISLHLSSLQMPYDLVSPSIWNRLSPLYAGTLLGGGENLAIWHHMRLIFQQNYKDVSHTITPQFSGPKNASWQE